MAPDDMRTTSVFLDFDGTISTTDIGIYLMNRLAGDSWLEIEDLYDRRLISSRECMRREWALLPLTDEALLRAVAAEVGTDPDMATLITGLLEAGAEVTVVSDSFGFYVPDAVSHLGVPVRTATVDWATGALLFPFENLECPCAECGTCKRAPVQEAAARGQTTIFVGDGSSDRHVASLVDRLYAKDALASWCQANDVAYTPFATLGRGPRAGTRPASVAHREPVLKCHLGLACPHLGTARVCGHPDRPGESGPERDHAIPSISIGTAFTVSDEIRAHNPASGPCPSAESGAGPSSDMHSPLPPRTPCSVLRRGALLSPSFGSWRETSKVRDRARSVAHLGAERPRLATGNPPHLAMRQLQGARSSLRHRALGRFMFSLRLHHRCHTRRRRRPLRVRPRRTAPIPFVWPSARTSVIDERPRRSVAVTAVAHPGSVWGQLQRKTTRHSASSPSPQYEDAACSGMEPDIFFPVRAQTTSGPSTRRVPSSRVDLDNDEETSSCCE
jgi:2-hydroxy-3-keto-5-methylthiopentenyl-1-phosphate phosphatase